MTVSNNVKEISIDVCKETTKALAIFTGILFLSPESGYIMANNIDNKAVYLKSRLKNRI